MRTHGSECGTPPSTRRRCSPRSRRERSPGGGGGGAAERDDRLRRRRRSSVPLRACRRRSALSSVTRPAYCAADTAVAVGSRARSPRRAGAASSSTSAAWAGATARIGWAAEAKDVRARATRSPQYCPGRVDRAVVYSFGLWAGSMRSPPGPRWPGRPPSRHRSTARFPSSSASRVRSVHRRGSGSILRPARAKALAAWGGERPRAIFPGVGSLLAGRKRRSLCSWPTRSPGDAPLGRPRGTRRCPPRIVYGCRAEPIFPTRSPADDEYRRPCVTRGRAPEYLSHVMAGPVRMPAAPARPRRSSTSFATAGR